jgi:hypothetical protein
MRNAKPAFTQHAKAAKHCDDVRIQVDQLTPNVVQDGNKELDWQKTKPTHKMQLKANYIGSVDR